jgi:hypothetical protein
LLSKEVFKAGGAQAIIKGGIALIHLVDGTRFHKAVRG